MARSGWCRVALWDGYGNGNGYGDGNGNGEGYGNGNGYGEGYGNGYGYGDGNGNGNGPKTAREGERVMLDYTTLMAVGTPVVCRAYTSGVVVGRLAGGSSGDVALREWRWLRRWEGVSNEGSVYDLVHSDKVPSRRGPFEEGLTILQQADLMEISEECYTRLASG